MFDHEDDKALDSVSWIGTQEWKSDRQQFASGCCLVYFKAVFSAAQPSKCELTISANNRYKLWVNGSRVCEGPCKGDRFRQFFDTVDVGALLVDGTNTIAVEVLYFSPALYRDGNKAGPLSIVSNTFGPMLAVGGEAIGADGSRVDLTTGCFDWRYLADKAIAWEMPSHIKTFMPIGAFECVDGGLLPPNWRTDPCLPSCWASAEKYYAASGSAWGEFSPLPACMRTIPFMAHRERGFVRVMKSSLPVQTVDADSVSIPAGSSFFAELDAGELLTGYFSLRTVGGEGSSVRIVYAESYSAPPKGQYRLKGRRDDCDAYEIFGYSDVYQPSGGTDLYEPYWWRTFRFVRIEVQTGGSALKLQRPGFVQTGYPLQELSGVSSESCGWIEPLWRTSVRTLKNCMHETHEDCPYYEQMQYALDTRLQVLFTYALGRDTRLARKAIEDFHCTLTPEGLLYSRAPTDEPNIVPVFSLYWIMMLEDYYIQTGDLDFVNFFRPTIDAVLAWFGRRVGSRGLVENLYYWQFIDWVEDWVNSDGAITAIPGSAESGPIATTNLIYSAALDCAARLLAHTRGEVAAEYAGRARAVRESAEKHFWNEDKKMYCEGIGTGEYTQHAQAFAVLSGLAAGEKAVQILTNAIADPEVKECTYVFSFFLFRALEQAGQYHLTQGLWTKWRNALELGLTTWPEDLKRQRSDCHAWGSLPIYEFVRCFCGVRALEPGYSKILVKPICTYISDFEGEIATPVGTVRVNWHIAGERMEIEGETPAGVPTTVSGPCGGELTLKSGGHFRASFPVMI